MGAPAQAQTLPDRFFGINGGQLKTATPERDQHLANIAAKGITHVRADLYWPTVEEQEPSRDLFGNITYRYIDFTAYDQFVAALAAMGLTWRPVIYSTPGWNRPPGGNQHSPPKEPALVGELANRLIKRYGPKGTFWGGASNPPHAVRFVEAWNEPNFAPSDNAMYRYPPLTYAKFLRAVAVGARSADSSVQVVVGGLVPHLNTTVRGISVKEFLDMVHTADPTVAAMTQGVATHIYGSSVPDVYWLLGQVRDQIVSTPFKHAWIHLNELGGPVMPEPAATKATREQARADALEAMAKRTAAASGPACKIGSIAPYAWITPETDPDYAEHWFGIAGRDPVITATNPERASAFQYGRGIAAAVPGNAACGTLPPA